MIGVDRGDDFRYCSSSILLLALVPPTLFPVAHVCLIHASSATVQDAYHVVAFRDFPHHRT